MMSNVMRLKISVGAAFVAALLWPVPSRAQEEATKKTPTLGEAISGGKVSLGLRYRFEFNDDDAATFAGSNGKGSTLRATLGYQTLGFHGLTAKLEFERVADVGLADEHNNAGQAGLANGITDLPVVPDPEITFVSQALLNWKFGGGSITAGRQEINLTDQRFVGAVGWRQHHQTFDAARLDVTKWSRAEFTYLFVFNQNRIFGDTKPMKSHLAAALVDLKRAGKLELYGYFLDYDRSSQLLGLSTGTVGGRIVGSRAFGKQAILYDGALAHQFDIGLNTRDVSVNYYKLEGGYKYDKFVLKLGFEILEGKTGEGMFTTPLATLHAFNGWADKFLRTPDDGLEDRYVSVAYGVKRLNLLGAFHQFRAKGADDEYGDELDVQATVSTPWEIGFGLKGALYFADSWASDTTKWMLWSSYTF